ncbi:unnamed protein product [Bursaphelenchus okinawaensis]|uniref:PH domain-containing protein n=1 Tax=Bursaphelenchus okinawaensis TaxID=465554 RepID=A0A811KLH9_9BILA|nr:unnamed protein product [Bursaphelenchus okinawaensis]CAG9107054.1 unnamed protein product [Bursaphelenchus okinawaensis]
MEDDNALDIVKWLFKSDTIVDLEGTLKIIETDKETVWNARLRGNLLGLQPVDVIVEPYLLICEKLVVKRTEDQQKPRFCVTYGQSELLLEAESETKLYDWMVKLAICSHQKTQAELDAVLNEFNLEAAKITSEVRSPGSPMSHFFLTCPIKKDHTFSVFHSFNMPNRTITCEEIMYESKLSVVIPTNIISIFEKWWTDLRADLLQHLSNLRNASMDAASHYVIRHLNSNLEIYSQMKEFMQDYSGPNFRSSKEKYRLAFGLVPTNLHVQSFKVAEHEWNYVTCGAIAGTPLRFKLGGLSRLRDTLMAGLQPNSQDYLLETRFFTRRKTLINAKRVVGDLSRRVENDWNLSEYGKVDKVGIKLFSEVKQLYELLTDLINSFPNVHNLVDALCPGGLAQLEHRQGEDPLVSDTLATQLDALEAAVISLNTKMAVIDKVEDNTDARVSFKENAKASLNAVLDMILKLIDSLFYGQLLGVIVALRKQSDASTYFHMQIRHDMIMSQAVTLISTCLLTALETLSADKIAIWQRIDPLVTYFGFLSCYGDERGMMEDMREIWSVFYGRVQFKFIEANSTYYFSNLKLQISRPKTCIPQVDGEHPTDLTITIPLTSDLMAKLPERMKKGETFRVRTFYWNIGVNHEATYAMRLGDISLEESINITATTLLSQYVNEMGQEVKEETHRIMEELKRTVDDCPSRKNMAMFSKVQDLTRALNGVCVISCKSGKDRSSMGITLEEGRSLKETIGISQQQVEEIVDCLRRDGVRRENCRKNVGKAMYSFSPFQMHFLPKEFRPPAGTFTHNVSS